MLHRGSISGPSTLRQQPVARARSSTLRRAGTSLSTDPHSPQQLSSGGGFASTLLQESAPLLPGTGELSPAAADAHEAAVAHVPSEESYGLTPASLKHLKRKHEALVEEKARLQTEIAGLQAQTREQRQRVATLEEEAKEAEARQSALEEEAQKAWAAEEGQRSRAAELDRCNSKLEDLLAEREAELARLREALEQQRRLTREVCEAAEQRTEAPAAPDTSDFELQIKRLEAERDSLREQMRQQALEQEDMKRSAVAAMAAAEKAIAVHAMHLQRTEALRAAKLMEAINSKVELHISVPRVTLSYNGAPPLVVSVAHGLSDSKIRDFLDRDVFPHFEPLWVRIDSLDHAPDGSAKRAYCSRMLERLTDAVKAFIMKSQTAEAGSDLCLSSDTQGSAGGQGSRGGSDLCLSSSAQGPVGGQGSRAGAAGDAASRRSSGAAGDAASRRNSTAGGGGSQGGGGGAAAQGLGGLGDADRERLLQLLRSGDDRGLDSKLVQLMGNGP